VTDSPRIALVSYSTKPRGGVVHTLSLGEALAARGVPVHVFALGAPGGSFFRPVDVPFTLIQAPDHLPTLQERVFASVDALEAGLGKVAGDFDILHTQDCISARAAARVRDAGAEVTVVRTVHHVDDFTTPALIECQRQAILEPDRVIVVSNDWHERLRDEYGVASQIIHNGVDTARFGPIEARTRSELRRRAGVEQRFVFLAVGGVEPRKGSVHLFRALAELVRAEQPGRGGSTRGTVARRPALVIIGGHSFQDYTDYRESALARLGDLGLELGRDVILAGTVTDEELHHWYRSADALAFPSLKEGWGLAVLEAMSADLPVVSSDIAVLQEYLTDHVDAVLTRAGDAADLARGMREVMADAALRERLVRGGREVAQRFTWARAAAAHEDVYRSSLVAATMAAGENPEYGGNT
jgi:glycosyltransferase-like protein